MLRLSRGRDSYGLMIMMKPLLRRAVVACCLFVSSLPAVEPPPRLPVETFFKNPQRASMSLSADGRYITALAPFNGRMNAFIVDTKEVSGRWLTGFKDENVASVSWLNDERLLVTLEGTGKPVLATALFTVKKDGTDLKAIVEPFGGGSVFRYTRVLDILPQAPDEILVVSNERNADFPDVYRMRVNRPGKRMHVRNPGDITDWITDREGGVRLGIAVSKDGLNTSVRYRRAEDADWVTLATFRLGDPSWTPLGFDADNQTLLVASDHEGDHTAIYRYNPEANRFIERLWHADGVTATGVVISGKHNRTVGVAVSDEVHSAVHWLDPYYAGIQRELDAAFPGQRVVFRPAGRNGTGPSDRDESRFIVITYSSARPPAYHLLDAKAFKITLISESRPWINPEQMAKARPIEFTARDGRRITGYLTLPPGRGEKNHALVLHPHGGPWARDEYGFNPELQYFANRGFAVLQVNYRGSAGLGRDLLMAGRKQFGQSMQNDLIDALQWAIAEGYADPKRVGVYGASYGGYATMVALTKTPELFQWGINYVGVVDLVEHINWYKKVERDTAYNYWVEMVGDPRTEADMLRENSPIHFVDRIKVPLFVIHGTQDFQVSIEQTLMLRRSLDAAGVPYRTNIRKDEGHGYRKEENMIALYQEFDEFLAPFMP